MCLLWAPLACSEEGDTQSIVSAGTPVLPKGQFGEQQGSLRDTCGSSPGQVAPEPSPPCSASPRGPLVTAQVLAGPFCSASLSSEVGASSHPSSRTPQWGKIHQNSSQISPNSRASLSRGAAMGMAAQGLGWTVTTHSSGATKRPRSSNHDPRTSWKKKTGIKENPNERHSPDFPLTENPSEQQECCYPFVSCGSHTNATSSCPQIVLPEPWHRVLTPCVGHCCLYPQPRERETE